MNFRLFAPLFAAFWLAAHAARAAEDDASRLPRQELTPQILFQFLLAEIAGTRGEVGLAVEAYRDLARNTRDPRIARRAAEIAFYARRYDIAIESARLWIEVEPESALAQQMMTALLAAAGRIEELAAHLSRQLAAEKAGAGFGPSLMHLNRQLARLPDKRATLRLVEQLTVPYTDIAEARFARAQAAHNAGDQALAVAEIDEALSLRPDWEPAALMRAQLAAKVVDALDFLGRFVSANPKASEARLAYARLLVGERRYADARREFGELLAAAPDNVDTIYAVAVLSLQLNDLKAAEAHLMRLIELNSPEINGARIYLGQIAEEGKRWDEALKWYEEVAPGAQYLPARLRIAHVLVRQGKLDEARRHLRETAAADPRERTQLLIGEAQLLREAGRHADVFAVLDGGLAAQPDQPELLYETALAAERVGRIEQMERNLRRLIELKPDHAHAYNALGYSLVDRNVRLDEAQALIEKAVQLSPQDPYILDSKGWLLFRRGDTAGALEILRRALALRADPEIAAHLGEVLWAAGQRDEARKTWEDALKANPANAANETLLGTIRKFHP
ncbi:MAG: tetratricopeptide repeat protein [Candidatus Nitricoxidivorans perseverans]|uniref:Tetratricopeptide repeat protein n=1 Tax=Candidatus Nitricoxidivorans perseverans TaxID=2975601 RepID=A0AA49FJC1_9PROT|nr:MAG: tetratricopeptide repeat protein [Candidatus Nitricoxidivorans perseverans]